MPKAHEYRLPPGHADIPEPDGVFNHEYLLNKSRELGPIFAVHGKQDFVVFITDLAMAKRFLTENSENLAVISIDLTSLFPRGFLRTLRGEDHRIYRRRLLTAIHPELIDDLKTAFEETTGHFLGVYQGQQSQGVTARGFIDTLKNIATSMLLLVFFGVRRSDPQHSAFAGLFDELGPDGLVWEPGEKEKAVFSKIRLVLQGLVGRGFYADRSRGCVLGRLASDQSLDDTMIGNLIYMVEMGRFDCYSLFRWMVKFADDHPQAVEAIAGCPSGEQRTRRAEAFVLETLRMAQSERLMRLVEKDAFVDGYLIPHGATVQICTWQAHKCPHHFKYPLRFDANRFTVSSPGAEVYSPFGIGEHRCPFGSVVVTLAASFLSATASQFRIEGIDNGAPFRGPFHWQPAEDFTVTLHRR